MHKFRFASFAVLLSLVPLSLPAFAASKEMVQLQTQVQQLQDAVARLQQSNDERMGVLKDLVQQSSDSVNRMSLNVETLQKQLAAQQAAEGAKVDQVSGQAQALNDSLDEIKARMNRIEKVLADVQSQQQGFSASIQNLPQAGSVTGVPASAIVTPSPGTNSSPLTAAPVVRKSATPALANSPAAGPAAGPPIDELYRSAYSDYIAAKYPIAAAEFGDIIKSYPDNSLAGNSFYYLGEIDYRAGKYASAAKDYDKVLEQFPDSNKIPAAHLHKGEALIALKQNDAGVRELRTLIQRFPTSPEATQARSKLSGMGVTSKVRP